MAYGVCSELYAIRLSVLFATTGRSLEIFGQPGNRVCSTLIVQGRHHRWKPRTTHDCSKESTNLIKGYFSNAMRPWRRSGSKSTETIATSIRESFRLRPGILNMNRESPPVLSNCGAADWKKSRPTDRFILG